MYPTVGTKSSRILVPAGDLFCRSHPPPCFRHPSESWGPASDAGRALHCSRTFAAVEKDPRVRPGGGEGLGSHHVERKRGPSFRWGDGAIGDGAE